MFPISLQNVYRSTYLIDFYVLYFYYADLNTPLQIRGIVYCLNEIPLKFFFIFFFIPSVTFLSISLFPFSLRKCVQKHICDEVTCFILLLEIRYSQELEFWTWVNLSEQRLEFFLVLDYYPLADNFIFHVFSYPQASFGTQGIPLFCHFALDLNRDECAPSIALGWCKSSREREPITSNTFASVWTNHILYFQSTGCDWSIPSRGNT